MRISFQNTILGVAIGIALGASVGAHAVPTLQVGAPSSGTTCGPYAPYSGSTTNPAEDDTAITGGNTLCVGGLFKDDVVQLGEKYVSGGEDWSQVDSDLSPFDGYGAVLIATVPEGTLASALASLTINGSLAFASSATNFFLPPHDPVKDPIGDFLFFDIGNFSKTANTVPDFVSPSTKFPGEVKNVTLGGQGALTWIHFDVMALETSITTNGPNTRITTNDENNPFSHDVTWKPGGGPPFEVPEPTSLLLTSVGLIGLALARRRKPV